MNFVCQFQCSACVVCSHLTCDVTVHLVFNQCLIIFRGVLTLLSLNNFLHIIKMHSSKKKKRSGHHRSSGGYRDRRYITSDHKAGLNKFNTSNRHLSELSAAQTGREEARILMFLKNVSLMHDFCIHNLKIIHYQPSQFHLQPSRLFILWCILWN